MHSEEEKYYLSYMSLRMAIGWLGFLMPIAVRVGAYAFQGIWSPATISAYYYTGMREVFVGSLVLIGALLMCYRTPDKRDTWLGIATGLAAIGIALFPMDVTFAKELIERYPESCFTKCFVVRGFLGFHSLFVGAFFGLAFYLMYFRFAAHTPASPTVQKVTRNRVYRICAVVMVSAGLSMLYFTYIKYVSGIFWSEAIAVMAFAAAWLIKGQLLLKDKVPAIHVAA